MDKLLYDNFLHVPTGTCHSSIECSLQILKLLYSTLTMTGRRHKRLNHARETNLLTCLNELLVCLCIEIFRCSESKFLGCKVTNSLTVHCIVHRTSRRHNLNTLLLELEETLCTDSLNLRHDDIRLMLVHYGCKSIAVEH